MKKISTLLIALCAVVSLQAQGTKTNFTNMAVESDGAAVTVRFTADIGRKAAAGGKTVIYAPVISNGRYSASLPAIIVQGKRAETNWQRHEWAADHTASYENGTYTKNGAAVNYTASVPFQPWMNDSRLEIETVTAGCCNSDVCLSILAVGILPAPEAPAPVRVVKTEPVRTYAEQPRQSVVDFLHGAFSFVHPVSDFDRTEPMRFFDDERDDALTIYYRLNQYEIEKDYADNRQTLINLISAISLIQESGEADIKYVVVAGFASPEGPIEVNDRLAWERAVSVKEYIMMHSGMPGESIALFNGSADWYGLRRLIAADPNVPWQREALDIIDHNVVWNVRTQTGRQTLLRNLRGGTTWAYISENFFPKLRNGTFIRVYFEKK